uniref:Uncharacterized protein n=1 Tax=Oryza nivara TaxID=4536 RepID=A0A0E0FLI8_ORYNI
MCAPCYDTAEDWFMANLQYWYYSWYQTGLRLRQATWGPLNRMKNPQNDSVAADLPCWCGVALVLAVGIFVEEETSNSYLSEFKKSIEKKEMSYQTKEEEKI